MEETALVNILVSDRELLENVQHRNSQRLLSEESLFTSVNQPVFPVEEPFPLASEQVAIFPQENTNGLEGSPIILDDHDFRMEYVERTIRPRPDDAQVVDVDANHEDNDTDEEATACTICYEPWTTSGSHRLCSLRCGHLFGKSCIKRWIERGGSLVTNSRHHRHENKGACPICKRPAYTKDIRHLYARRMIAVDDGTEQELRMERKLRMKIDQQLHETLLQCNVLRSEKQQLESEIYTLQCQLVRSRPQQVVNLSGTQTFANLQKEEMTLAMENFGTVPGQSFEKLAYKKPLQWVGQNFPDLFMLSHEPVTMRPGGSLQRAKCMLKPCKQTSISAEEKARCLEYLAMQDTLIMSKYNVSANTIRPYSPHHSSWGLTKLSLLDLAPSHFIPVHAKEIKDLRNSPRSDGLLLSASLDRTVCITNMCTDNIVHRFQLDRSVWSCEWSHRNSYQIFCGMGDGTIIAYDFRRPNDILYQWGPFFPQGSSEPSESANMERAVIEQCRSTTIVQNIHDTTDSKVCGKPLHSLYNVSTDCLPILDTKHSMMNMAPTEQHPCIDMFVCGTFDGAFTFTSDLTGQISTASWLPLAPSAASTTFMTVDSSIGSCSNVCYDAEEHKIFCSYRSRVCMDRPRETLRHFAKLEYDDRREALELMDCPENNQIEPLSGAHASTTVRAPSTSMAIPQLVSLFATHVGSAGHTCMAREALYTPRASSFHSPMALCSDEYSRSLLLFDLESQSIVQQLGLQSQYPILAICPFQNQRAEYVACLTKDQLSLFEWTFDFSTDMVPSMFISRSLHI